MDLFLELPVNEAFWLLGNYSDGLLTESENLVVIVINQITEIGKILCCKILRHFQEL